MFHSWQNQWNIVSNKCKQAQIHPTLLYRTGLSNQILRSKEVDLLIRIRNLIDPPLCSGGDVGTYNYLLNVVYYVFDVSSYSMWRPPSFKIKYSYTP